MDKHSKREGSKRSLERPVVSVLKRYVKNGRKLEWDHVRPLEKALMERADDLNGLFDLVFSTTQLMLFFQEIDEEEGAEMLRTLILSQQSHFAPIAEVVTRYVEASTDKRASPFREILGGTPPAAKRSSSIVEDFLRRSGSQS